MIHQPKKKPKTSICLLTSMLAICSFALASCTDKRHDCVARATCAPFTSTADGGTESGGSAPTQRGGTEATTGEAGTTSATVSAGAGGVNSESDTQGVAGSISVTTLLPCGGKCGADKPICDEQTNTCVECTGSRSESCTVSGKICGANKSCVECESIEHCQATSGRPVCDTSPDSAKRNTCVQCVTNKDCTSAEASVCDLSLDPSTNLPKKVCVGCVTSGDCSHVDAKHVCLPGTGTTSGHCVQCTKDDARACTLAGNPTLCHGILHTCTDKTKGSARSCESCVADAQCRPGQACVQEAFGLNQELIPQYACLWKKGDPAPGAPADCSTADNQPYVVTRTDVTTVDGATATVCGLSVSTCAAWAEAKSPTIDCAPEGIPNHVLCIIDGLESARCILASTDRYQCSPRCVKNSDCLSISSCVTPDEQACNL